MQTDHIVNCVEEIASVATLGSSTIRCYLYPPLTAAALWPRLVPTRELAAEAMTLLMRVDADLRQARADWNEDRFRRLMRVRPRAISRLFRRWERLDPKPVLELRSLRRRYHANIALYLNPVSQDC